VKKKARAALGLMAITGSLAAFAMPKGGSSAKLGFLFAVRNPDKTACSEDFCQGRFETRLLVIDGDKMRIAVQTPHLYIPRNSGFWEVGALAPKSPSNPQSGAGSEGGLGDIQPGSASSEFSWRLWAAPIGKRPTRPASSAEQDSSADESASDIRRIELDWVGTDYLSFVEQIGEYTETHAILSIEEVARNAFDQLWKPAVPEAVYKKDLDGCVDEGSDFNTRTFLEGAEQGWSITRGRLRWEFNWAFGYSSGAARGYGTGCSTSLRPPKELVGSDALGVGWNQVLSQVPDALTAYSSPDHSIVLVLTSGQVLALKHEGDALGAPFARVFLSSSEVVSAQWAVGKYADAWSEQLSLAKSWTEKDKAVTSTSHQ
jgi:hypothetical protein